MRHPAPKVLAEGRPPRRWPDSAVAGLVIVLLVAAVVRFVGVGDVDLRGDEVELYERLQAQPTLGELLKAHYDEFGLNRQMPIPRMAAAFLTLPWGVEVTPFLVRLAFVLAGIAAAAALWWFGLQLGGVGTATILGLMGALNPCNLYWSRTGHVYAFPMLFAALFFAAIARLTINLWCHGRASRGLWWVTCLAGIAACYSHMSAWPAVFLAWGFPLSAWYGRGDRSLATARPLLMCIGAWGLSLAPWGVAFLAPYFGKGELHGVFQQGNAGWYHEVSQMWRLPFVYTFGGGWRSVLTLGLPLVALVDRRTRGYAALLAAYGVVLFVGLTVAQSIGFHSLRYYAPLWPILLAVAALGATAAGSWVVERLRVPPVGVATAGAALLLAATLAPVRALIELRGNPVEYSRISENLDALFPEETPALVNGRLVVEHEMRPHAPQKVVPTFTVSDIGFEQWKNNRWRETAEDFLTRFGDAPLVQQGKNFYDHPEAGPWAFPDDYFARRVVLRNEQALLLQRLVLAPIEDIYGGRGVTEISYNLPEDLIARAEEQGRPAVALWGPGWRYEKTADFRDWRVLTDRAEIHLHNLTDSLLDATVLMDIWVPAGRKRVRVGDQSLHVDRSEDIQLLRVRQRLAPGENVLVLEDVLYPWGRVSMRVAAIRLETEDVRVGAEDSADGGAAGDPGTPATR
ncbi:MAG: hypothetical protein AAGD06_17990 [Acidobacteriota bacterium]